MGKRAGTARRKHKQNMRETMQIIRRNTFYQEGVAIQTLQFLKKYARFMKWLF